VGSGLWSIWQAFHYEAHTQLAWMRVNLILAVLPVTGAILLYAGWRWLSVLRWPLLLATGLLLPNAPYVVTDLIHLDDSLRRAPGPLYVWAGVIPLYACLIATGVLSYAFTLHLMRKGMRSAGWSRRRRVTVEVVVGFLCALGVALGRISRLNSWDVMHPTRLASGLATVSLDPRSVVFALIIVIVAGVVVDWLASGAAHSLRDRMRHR
jgi:uncharacterized membrane protein